MMPVLMLVLVLMVRRTPKSLLVQARSFAQRQVIHQHLLAEASCHRTCLLQLQPTLVLLPLLMLLLPLPLLQRPGPQRPPKRQ